MAVDAGYRTTEPSRLRLLDRFRELIRHREVVANLTDRELKAKYKSTVLGVIWSMLNPALYLLVFFVVFTFFLGGAIPNFAVYLVSGLLAYTMFSTGLQGATASVVENAALVTKVAFPREILPLSAVGASLVNFFYQFIVLFLFITAFRYPYWGANLVLLPAGLAVLLLLTTALGMGTAALNVRYRDTSHLIELALLAWFWMTPIIYPASIVLTRFGADSLPARLFLANPLAAITLAFQRAIYGGTSEVAIAELPTPDISWYLFRLGVVALASVALLAVSWWAFFRMSGDFAEEL